MLYSMIMIKLVIYLNLLYKTLKIS